MAWGGIMSRWLVKQRKIHQQKSGLTSGKLTCNGKRMSKEYWKINFLLSMLIFHWHVSLLECICFVLLGRYSEFHPRIQTARLPKSFTSEFHRVSDKPCCRSKSSNRTFCKTSSIATSGIWCSTWGYRSCSLSEPRNIYGFCGMKNTEPLSHNSSAGPRRNAPEDFATGPQMTNEEKSWHNKKHEWYPPWN